jgi:hypothetical protein
MLSPLRNRFGIPGVISVIALVFAMFGGAYAASSSSDGKKASGKATASAKKAKRKAKRGPRGPKGPAGPAGAQGPAGPQGAPGAKGENGANGAQGPQGPQGPQGIQGKEGKEGSPWTAGGTLPAGETETGTFSLTVAPVSAGFSAGAVYNVPISFPIPLANPLAAGKVHLLNADGSKEFVINEETTEGEEITPTDCGTALTPAGTASDPAAAPGGLCIYAAYASPSMKEHSGSNIIADPSVECLGLGCLLEFGGPGSGAGVSGARLQYLNAPESGVGIHGTWAVTAL